MIHVSKYVQGCLSAILCEVLFGFSFIFTKKATESVFPGDLLGWRFAAAAILIGLCAAFRLIRLDLKSKKILKLGAAGLLFPGIYYVLEAFGVRLLTASETGILVASVPAVTLLLCMIFLKERPSRLQCSGIFLSIAGVIFCAAAKQSSAGFNLLGYLLVGSGILSFCFFTICTRKLTEFTNVEKTFVFLMEAGIIYFSLAIAKNIAAGTVTEFLLLPFHNRDLLYAALYLSTACSVVCMFLCNYSIGCIGPARFTSFIGIETVVSVTAGILLLGEPVYLLQLGGAILIICGVYMANKTSGKSVPDNGEFKS